MVINVIQKICTFISPSLSTMLSPQVSGKISWNQGWLMVWNWHTRAQRVNQRARLFPAALGVCAPVQRVCGHPLWLSSPSRAVSGSERISVEFRSNWFSGEAQTAWWRDVFFGMRRNDHELETPSRTGRTFCIAAAFLQKLSCCLRVTAWEWNLSGSTLVTTEQAVYKKLGASTDFWVKGLRK